MKPALLLVDLQSDYLAAPALQPPADFVVAKASALLEGCRKRRIPVVHIWTTVLREEDRRLPHWKREDRWMCVAGTPGHEPPPALRPLANETIVHKTGFNPFADPALENVLRATGVDTVIVAGLHLHACIRTAAVECLERGFCVRVVEDAVASNDPVHAAATRHWMAERCVVFEPLNAILARCDGRGAEPLVHHSPRQSDQILFEVPVAGAREVSIAAAAAQSAWTQWRQSSSSTRQHLLLEITCRLEAAAPELARQMALEIGKPLTHGLEEVRRAVANVSDVARRLAQQSALNRKRAGIVRHRSIGVVGIISAWNNPVAVPLGKIAPALACGNTVVWKPAPAATRIAQALLSLLREAGAPADAVQLVTGDHTTAQQIAADPNVNAVTLTGSLAAGYAIQEICARRIVPLQAELSGNNAAIVWDDADLSSAAGEVAWGAFAFAGQRCTANRRVIISTPRFEAFVNELKLATNRLAWGDPLDTATEIGPLINTAKRDELASLVATARASGAAHDTILFHEERARESWALAGAYAAPVIVVCDQSEHPLVQEETMSPLLVVQRADDFDHALALCNGVRHGLVASLFSNRRELRHKFMNQVQAGILKFNTSTAGADATLPFGGWKASGIGPPEHGEGDWLFYTRMQSVYGADD